MRELVWRNYQEIEPMRMFEGFAKSIRSIEGARMQISGTLADIPCGSCARGNGMFGQCVVILGHEGVKHCANCHIRGHDMHCYFHNKQRHSSRTSILVTPAQRTREVPNVPPNTPAPRTPPSRNWSDVHSLPDKHTYSTVPMRVPENMDSPPDTPSPRPRTAPGDPCRGHPRHAPTPRDEHGTYRTYQDGQSSSPEESLTRHDYGAGQQHTINASRDPRLAIEPNSRAPRRLGAQLRAQGNLYDFLRSSSGIRELNQAGRLLLRTPSPGPQPNRNPGPHQFLEPAIRGMSGSEMQLQAAQVERRLREMGPENLNLSQEVDIQLLNDRMKLNQELAALRTSLRHWSEGRKED